MKEKFADIDQAVEDLLKAAAIEEASTAARRGPAYPIAEAKRHRPAVVDAATPAKSQYAKPEAGFARPDQQRAQDAPNGASATPRPNGAREFPTAAAPTREQARSESTRPQHPREAPKPIVGEKPNAEGMVTIDGNRGPIAARERPLNKSADATGGKGPVGKGPGGSVFHKRLGPVDFGASLKAGLTAVRRNLAVVMVFTVASNALVLAIPIYLFQISDRILTSRSIDTLIMLTLVIVGAVILQSMFDAIRRFILMRTAVEFATQLGSPVLSAAARASLHGNGREYQTLGDLQQVRSFLVSRTLLSFLDAPIAPLFVLAVFLIHPHLGFIVVSTALLLLALTLLNQRVTATPFGEANTAQVKANLHLESMSRNSQIINALAMIPEAVHIWGRDTASSLKSQVIAQDRNIVFAAMSKGSRLLTQVAMLGWGAYLAIEGEITGGMVIAASIIAGRALAPIEGAIEGWNQYSQSRASYGRIAGLLKSSPFNFERLQLPRPEGRLDVERLLYVPQGTKRVVLNGISFALSPGDSLAVIGNSGAGKTTLGKMLVGSILPTSGNVRLDLMDLRNWDQRQFGENIGYLPQDVQLFPGTIKANIARMRDDATDAQIYEAAMLADVHEMIATLPHGYETVVAADGSPLSGGQKQRIALARAFFGNPRMVVLDEPNSNLDSAGDTALQRALQHAKKNRITVITITQRPALLGSVDKILLLVNGTVALFGVRKDVLQALAARGVSIESGSFGHQIQ
ncbi:type I secretion system permease/ATPase [Nitratireductor luteus]|uniref:type I secretion system permease/ATPase n=1 Tax=Nitratireductor luteus TaxID=2976980 RepID=UPI003B847317